MELCEIDLGNIMEFWVRPEEEIQQAFAVLRAKDPIRFCEERDYILDGEVITAAGPGFWSITRHADIIEASRRTDLFCSGHGTQIADLPTEFNEFLGSMINMDDPRHARLRRLVSRGFTPRTLARVEEQVARVAAEIVDDLAEVGECDFVTDVAARLPLQIICEMMGIPPSHYQDVFDHTNILLSAGDPEYVPEGTNALEAFLHAAAALAGVMTELASFRTNEPADDLTSALLHAEIDGEQLSHQELASFFVLCVPLATKPPAMPSATGWWLSPNIPSSARFGSPISRATPRARSKRSCVGRHRSFIFDAQSPPTVRDLETMSSPKARRWCCGTTQPPRRSCFRTSRAVRSESVPQRSHRLRRTGSALLLGCSPGATGIGVMYRELLGRFPNIGATAPPERLRSNFINGIKHLPCSVS